MWLLERPIAHRGLHDESATENSMAAFKKAIEHNYFIEIDVHLLADEEVVVFHDESLMRVVGKDVKISQLTTADIKGDQYLLPNGEHIPLLRELLEFVEGKTKLLIELKTATIFNNRLEEKVLELIKGKEDFVAVQSFSPPIVNWFAKNAPEFYIGALSTYVKAKILNRPILWLTKKAIKKSKLDFLAFNILNLPNKKVAKIVEKNNIKFLSWTIKSPADLNKAKECKVDNIIFEGFELKDGKY